MYRDLLKKVYYLGVSAMGLRSLRLKQLGGSGQATVLNFHRVTTDASSFWPPLHPRIFEEVLRFLQTNFEVRRIADLGEAHGSRPIAALSFDDGYYDFIEYALPLLEKYRMPVNMNVIPECSISGKPIWNVQLYDYLNAASSDLINEMEVPGFSGRLKNDTESAKLLFGLELSRHLKNRKRNERDEIWKSIRPNLEKVGVKGTRMMTTQEIRGIGSMVEIGVHSYSHESMGFEDQSFFERDFEKCREYFSSELGLPLSIYAFPNGSYRTEQIGFLRANKIMKILLVDEKFADRSSDVLTRITMYGDSSGEICGRALGF